MVIVGGIAVGMLGIFPISLFPEFLTEEQDIIILILMIVSAVLLFVSGAVYKKTES